MALLSPRRVKARNTDSLQSCAVFISFFRTVGHHAATGCIGKSRARGGPGCHAGVLFRTDFFLSLQIGKFSKFHVHFWNLCHGLAQT